jgi:dTDP-glucose 4,6-dehydratase
MTDSYNMQNVLVTGGAGFIGCNFIRYLLNKKEVRQIVNLDALTYAGSIDNLHGLDKHECYQFVRGNIIDAQLVKKLLEQFEIDTIIHFAAESDVDRSIDGPKIFVETNVLGTFNLLEAARCYWLEDRKQNMTNCRFHHISTDEVYGTLQANDPAFCETTAYAPNSPYAASKAGSDHLVRAYFHTYGLPTTISNCSNNFGPYQHMEKFIPMIIMACLQGKAIPVYGDGSNIRDWLYVDDHCRGIEAVIELGKVGESYNIGGNNECSNLALTKIICQLMDELYPKAGRYQDAITFVTDRPGHDWRYAIDYQKISEELNWQPQQSFKNGLIETIQFYHDKYQGSLSQ